MGIVRVETGDNSGVNSASQGQIRIDNGNSNTLQFRDDDNDTAMARQRSSAPSIWQAQQPPR